MPVNTAELMYLASKANELVERASDAKGSKQMPPTGVPEAGKRKPDEGNSSPGKCLLNLTTHRMPSVNTSLITR